MCAVEHFVLVGFVILFALYTNYLCLYCMGVCLAFGAQVEEFGMSLQVCEVSEGNAMMPTQ